MKTLDYIQKKLDANELRKLTVSVDDKRKKNPLFVIRNSAEQIVGTISNNGTGVRWPGDNNFYYEYNLDRCIDTIYVSTL